MSETLSGKRALVTGAGSGLGSAIVADLAEAGVQVYCADIDPDKANEIACNHGGCTPIQLDVSDAEQIARVWKTLDDEGGVDILVNNAGVDHTVAVTELTVDQIDHVLDVNLRGPFLMSREALARWGERGDGEIVNICSTAAKRAWPNASAYHASKWGLLGLSHALHVEGRQAGVRVTAVVVGGMRTPFILERFPDTPLENLQDPANVARVIRHVLLMPSETGVPEVMVVPMTETSWP